MELAKKLSSFDELRDEVIAETKFERGNFFPDAKILKRSHGLTLVRVSTCNEELTAKIFKPKENSAPAKKILSQPGGELWKNFSAPEVFNFVEEVGDKNKIHRTENPIVPGLLILKNFLDDEKFSGCKSVTMKFKSFVTAGENLFLTIDGNNFEISTADEVKITGNFF